jgi:hypothetical protein
MTTKLSIGHKIYQRVLKYSKQLQNIPIFSSQMPIAIYPTKDFWHENIPSGNCGGKQNSS